MKRATESNEKDCGQEAQESQEEGVSNLVLSALFGGSSSGRLGAVEANLSSQGSTESVLAVKMRKGFTMNHLQNNRGFDASKPVKVCQSLKTPECLRTPGRFATFASARLTWQRFELRWISASFNPADQRPGNEGEKVRRLTAIFGIIQHYSGLAGRSA